MKDFYDDIVGFMRNFFSGAFKDNKNLSYGFLPVYYVLFQYKINLIENPVMEDMDKPM